MSALRRRSGIAGTAAPRSAPRFRWQGELVEEWLFRHQQSSPESARAAREYRRRAEALYDLADPAERDGAFQRLHLELFRERGLGAAVEGAFLGSEPVREKVEEVLVGRTFAPSEEGADLDRAGGARRRVGLQLSVDRALDPARLAQLLRREVLRVEDLLSSGFGFEGEDPPGATTGQARVVRDRYGVLWDLSIDGRLRAEDAAFPVALDDHARRLRKVFAWLAPEEAERVARFVLDDPPRTHQALLEAARDPRGLLGRAGVTAEPVSAAGRPGGSACPLCRFPAFRWGDLSHPRRDEVLAKLREHFPGFQEAEGLCERCFDLYKIRAGVWT
jgi:hypothetical protein